MQDRLTFYAWLAGKLAVAYAVGAALVFLYVLFTRKINLYWAELDWTLILMLAVALALYSLLLFRFSLIGLLLSIMLFGFGGFFYYFCVFWAVLILTGDSL